MTDLLSRRAAARTEARRGGNVGTSPAPATKFAQVQEDARKRTAYAWTAAKNLLPGAPIADQQKLASALICTPTRVLADTLRSVARMAFYTIAAEKFEAGTKKELNVLIEDEGMMKKLRNEVFAENKGEAIPDGYHLSWNQHEFRICLWWGWQDHYREAVSTARMSTEALDFSEFWGAWAPIAG